MFAFRESSVLRVDIDVYIYLTIKGIYGYTPPKFFTYVGIGFIS